jgi:chromosome segregation ATPase
MRDNLKDQKDTETKVRLAEILLAEKTTDEFKSELTRYEQGLEDTV